MAQDIDLVVAYHEREKHIQAAMKAKRAKRDRLVEKAAGMDSLVLGDKFEFEDLDLAGEVILELMQEHPDLEMSVLQDLAAERALVGEATVLAAVWEQVGKGTLKLKKGMRPVLAEDFPGVG